MSKIDYEKLAHQLMKDIYDSRIESSPVDLIVKYFNTVREEAYDDGFNESWAAPLDADEDAIANFLELLDGPVSGKDYAAEDIYGQEIEDWVGYEAYIANTTYE